MKFLVLRKSLQGLFHLFPCNLPRYSQILTGVLEFSSISLCLGVCALGCFGTCALVRGLGKDPGYKKWDRKLAIVVLRELGRRGDETETAEVLLKPRKDPTESFLKPRKVSGIRVGTPSCV